MAGTHSRETISFTGLNDDSAYRQRIHIFYKGKKLSKSLGIYTSIRSKGRFDGSYEADWNLLEKTADSLSAQGQFKYFPISLVWTFRKEETGFGLNVKMTIHESVELDCEQMNIMLPEQYNQWGHETRQGNFPEVFNRDFSGDWDCQAEFSPPG